MFNLDSATIEGHATHDPVVRKTKTGKTVCNFSVAINHFSSPDSQPKVSYIDVETWENVANICSSTIKKGKKVMVIGPLRQDRWEDENGKIRSRMKIVGNQVRFLEAPSKTKN